MSAELLSAEPAVELREEPDGWAILFNPGTADALGINPVGVVVWMLLDGRHRVEDIVAEVRTRFDGVPASAADEIAAFVSELVRGGFVRREAER